MNTTYSCNTIIYADLETTVYEGQETTAAWSSAFMIDGMEEPIVFYNLADSWKWIKKIKGNILIYYHNLKFDGSYWIDFFERNHIARQGIIKQGDEIVLKKKHKLFNGEYTYNISAKGIWYNIILKRSNRFIEFRDSLKLMPFRLEKIGKDFKTKHQKLEMDYEGKKEGYIPNEEEREYIKNDIYVLKEACEMMFAEGHDRITIGSCCLNEYKHLIGNDEFKSMFPDVYKIPLSKEYFGKRINFNESVGEYVLHSYRGAFCDVGEKFKKREIVKGFTLDVTSLYPSVMHSKSGNRYPMGIPRMWQGDFIPDVAMQEDRYFFVRFRCAFKVKPGFLPFVQIKGDFRYRGTEHLKTSAVYHAATGEYSDYLETEGGSLHRVELTMCQDEYFLFLEHYDTQEMEILDGLYFWSDIGMFDMYIDKWFKKKSESTGAVKAIAKLFLNNLYGKFATSPDSSYKILTMGEDNILHYSLVSEADKAPGYIPVGSAITAKARCFTIRAAQKNINRFCYADTDSLHLLGDPSEALGVTIAENELCTWKLESQWDRAYFTRQKTYIELTEKEAIIKCAGMPDRCKDLFAVACGWKDREDLKKLTAQEEEFLKYPKQLTDFDIGLTIPSKLYSKMIPGGTLLYKDYYQMR